MTFEEFPSDPSFDDHPVDDMGADPSLIGGNIPPSMLVFEKAIEVFAQLPDNGPGSNERAIALDADAAAQPFHFEYPEEPWKQPPAVGAQLTEIWPLGEEDGMGGVMIGLKLLKEDGSVSSDTARNTMFKHGMTSAHPNSEIPHDDTMYILAGGEFPPQMFSANYFIDFRKPNGANLRGNAREAYDFALAMNDVFPLDEEQSTAVITGLEANVGGE